MTAAPRPGPAGVADRCAPTAERRGDLLAGSAAPVPRWLLVEHRGPWGRDALTQSALDRAVARQLAARAARARVRVVLIRRPGRPGTAAPGTDRRWAYVDSRPGREGSWWGSWCTDQDLLEVPLERTPPGRPDPAPIYLVCTHGRHDACCAIRGRPVAATLAAARPAATWECSHVGGDRFAANLVVLPHGLYYGRLSPAAAVDVARRYETRRLDPGHLRGRSSLPAMVQAAQHHARQRLGDDRLDAFPPIAVDRLDAVTWQVELGREPAPVTVVVRAGTAGVAPLTCSARHPDPIRTFDLVEFRPTPFTVADPRPTRCPA